MKKKILLLAAFLLAFVLCIPSVSAFDGNALDRAASASNGIISYKLEADGVASVQALIDSSFSQNAQSSEWYIMALAQSGEYDFSF